ncbi:ABC transporter ATP-binding protein [Actinokineospora pegani]|uniref:ABC transporter ATP-binding protein n=1 Tax=Actinokineospora pegani TaxID=2654637 RepID=UPI0012E9BEDC|nr:ABC transporter ATP-binding protein [Actinokineospora pegani]
MSPVIALRGVHRTYPGTPPVHALRETDLRVHPRDYVAVVGPSGSGKSTLLHLLGLLDTPTGGVYELNGADVSTLSDADRTAVRGTDIGFAFQSFHLLPHRTATENVELAMLYNRDLRRDRRLRAQAALDRVGLPHRADALPTTMSGGERQRVAIARAVVTRPSLLLCDEPTGNLDTATSASVLDLFDTLNADGHTIIMITHDPEVAARATRVVSIRDGRLACHA